MSAETIPLSNLNHLERKLATAKDTQLTLDGDLALRLIATAKLAHTAARGATWQTGEPPKDRPIVVFGKVIVKGEFSTGVVPLCGAIEWRDLNGHQDWYNYFGASVMSMTVRRALDEEVIIHNWIELPPSDPTYPPHKPDNMEMHE